MGKDVGSAERDDAETSGGTHKAVGDFGDRAVATGGYDHPLSASRCLTREGFGVTGTVGFSEIQPDAVGDQYVEHSPEKMCAPPSGYWVEDDHHQRIGVCLGNKEDWVPLYDVICMTLQ
jgi:hypothetical protein